MAPLHLDGEQVRLEELVEVRARGLRRDARRPGEIACRQRAPVGQRRLEVRDGDVQVDVRDAHPLGVLVLVECVAAKKALVEEVLAPDRERIISATSAELPAPLGEGRKYYFELPSDRAAALLERLEALGDPDIVFGSGSLEAERVVVCERGRLSEDRFRALARGFIASRKRAGKSGGKAAEDLLDRFAVDAASTTAARRIGTEVGELEAIRTRGRE